MWPHVECISFAPFLCLKFIYLIVSISYIIVWYGKHESWNKMSNLFFIPGLTCLVQWDYLLYLMVCRILHNIIVLSYCITILIWCVMCKVYLPLIIGLKLFISARYIYLNSSVSNYLSSSSFTRFIELDLDTKKKTLLEWQITGMVGRREYTLL